MPDKHKMKLFSHFKPSNEEEHLTPTSSNHSHASKKFLGFHIGKHESMDSLASPTMSNSSHHHPPMAQQATPSDRTSNGSPNHSPMNREDSHNFLKANSMVELKKFFKPIKKNSVNKVGDNVVPVYHNHIHSPPPIAAGQAILASVSAQHSREPSSTSLAALINQTSSQLLHHAQNSEDHSSSKAPFTDDESFLVKKYGKIDKELGTGAGGSVKLIVRPSDSKTFAVKEFRPRRNTESLKDYTRKCTAEYCIGSTLKHPNIIKTIDILHENDRYYEIMEYAPIDFFAVVMSGEMSRQEINCCLKQIIEGVKYLHSLGLAHRDLKLDNCVLTMDGILKIIDFGSAVIFRYPYDQYGNSKDSIHYCHGVVGSDPYLAPEVLKSSHSYNPQPVDLWSIAIIYCCMTLKRFPWKIPNPEKDESFRLYLMEDDNWHDYNISNECHKLLLQQRKLKNMIIRANKRKKALEEKHDEDQMEDDHNEEHDEKEILSDEKQQEILAELKAIDAQLEGYEATKQEMKTNFSSKRNKKDEHTPENNEDDKTKKKTSHKQIHGPYRLMRLLPHASRPIVSRMLQVDPTKRATLEEILEDEWIKEIQCCTLKRVTKSAENASAGVAMEEDEEDILIKGSPPHEHTVALDNDESK